MDGGVNDTAELFYLHVTKLVGRIACGDLLRVMWSLVIIRDTHLAHLQLCNAFRTEVRVNHGSFRSVAGITAP